MQLHGSPTPKRTTLWSCMPQVADLNLGVLTLEEKRKRTTTQTVRKYYDKRGKARFVGTSELSRSQKLGPHYFNLNEMGFQKHPLHMFMQLRIVSQVLFQDQISYCECLQCTDSNIMIHATILHQPRAYPEQFGKNLLRAFESHIASIGPGRRDLRFKPQFNKTLDEVHQFHLLATGDIWEEAGLLDAMTYLMTSKKCRRRSTCWLEFPCILDRMMIPWLNGCTTAQNYGTPKIYGHVVGILLSFLCVFLIGSQKNGKAPWLNSTMNFGTRPFFLKQYAQPGLIWEMFLQIIGKTGPFKTWWSNRPKTHFWQVTGDRKLNMELVALQRGSQNAKSSKWLENSGDKLMWPSTVYRTVELVYHDWFKPRFWWPN